MPNSTGSVPTIPRRDGAFHPVARSPIRPTPPVVVVAGWEVSQRRSGARLRLADLSPLAKVAVRTDPDTPLANTLGTSFGRAVRNAAAQLVVGSGPGEWLVLGPVGTAPEIVAGLEALAQAEPASIIDLSHGRAMVRLTGVDAARLLEKVCAIDLSDAATPVGTAFRSFVAHLVCDVVRDDLGGVRSYLIHCERSSGQYLFDCLVDAGAEFGIDADGFPEKEA